MFHLYIYQLLCLTPDDFTFQEKSEAIYFSKDEKKKLECIVA